MKISDAIRNDKGEAYITALIVIFIICMLTAVAMTVTSVIVKYKTVKQDIKRAIVTCEVENLDKQYLSLIEGECYDDSVNYSSPAYTSSFFSALEKSYKDISKSDSDSKVSYTVCNQSGQYAFDIRNLQLCIDVQNIPMPDAKTNRLVYKATGTMVIPLSVLGYSSSLSVPFTVTASFQNTA